ncbi:hypothetical protein Cabther_A0713 [Chloracidobacterium thermophilum B]|uniref:Uncharacterized protein n=1 Tax=Chloracidobacterium thermophilum (strain B) TaxID=981222 RepID=G2LGX0_CHLTF|nr:hypothetical protein Cabther_A0713 [Chloracidobacterium thermophilum B]
MHGAAVPAAQMNRLALMDADD